MSEKKAPPSKKESLKKKKDVSVLEKPAEVVENMKPTEPAEKEKKESLEKKTIKYTNQFSFTDPLQQKFVNCIMKRGKKTIAQRILRETFDDLARRGEKDPLKVFETAFQNATPTMEVRPKRIGGAVYQIPIEVTPRRQQSLSIRWILEGARSRKGLPMFRRLAAEIIDASQDTGIAVNKKKDAHKMAQANKAFAHLAKY